MEVNKSTIYICDVTKHLFYFVFPDVASSSSESDYESDSSSDEEIFRANVKLWKYSKGR